MRNPRRTTNGARSARLRTPYEMFLADYGDVLADAPMNELIDEFHESDAVTQLLAVAPQDSFHLVSRTRARGARRATPPDERPLSLSRNAP